MGVAPASVGGQEGFHLPLRITPSCEEGRQQRQATPLFQAAKTRSKRVETAPATQEGQLLFSESSWYQALTLRERLAASRISHDEAVRAPGDQLALATK